jgi:predicted PurR-regulated permease PerM
MPNSLNSGEDKGQVVESPTAREATPPLPAFASANGRGGNSQLAGIRATTVVALGTVIALLFFARDVFIPLSLSLLLSFLLAIPCSFLERHGFKRTPAVIFVVLLTVIMVAGAGWLLSSQIYNLAKMLPGYHEVIAKKLASLKTSPHGTFGQFNQMLKQSAEAVQSPDTKEPISQKTEKKLTVAATATNQGPIPVEIHQPPIGMWDVFRGMLAPVLKPLGTAFMVLVVLFFMLLGREDLRNRLIRLVGTERMDLTTDALDEAAKRVSRYLLMQLIVNCCFGVLIGTGLAVIGVPNPVLWGVLALLLRFIPYVGPWIAAVAPLALAFAVDPAWAKLAWTTMLFVTVELMVSNLIEPLLYGSSTGVSPIALLLAAIFWTWLWGPVGLLLSTPLTVCLAVMGLHIPQMRFLHVLLGDEPVLTHETRFYQRLLAMDREEADAIVEELLKEKPLAAVYQELILPALTYAKEDLARGRLTKEKENFVLGNIAELVEELAEEENTRDVTNENDPEKPALKPDVIETFVAVMPARDKPDEIAGIMLERILLQRNIGVRALSAAALTSDKIDDLVGGQVTVVCVSVVPPTNLRRTRYLCKKLRSRFPAMKLVIGFWGTHNNPALVQESLAACKPDGIACTIEDAIAAILTQGNIANQATVSRAAGPET